MSERDRFQALAEQLFQGVLENWNDNLSEDQDGTIVYQSAWKKDTTETFARLLKEEFGEDVLTERVLELQGQLAEARAQIRLLKGEQPLFPEMVQVAHA